MEDLRGRKTPRPPAAQPPSTGATVGRSKAGGLSQPTTSLDPIWRALAVPPELRNRPCHTLLARSIELAYNAVKLLRTEQDRMASNDTRVPKYYLDTFAANLGYHDRPLIDRARWADVLIALFFGDPARAEDLRSHGFTEDRLRKIWQATSSDDREEMVPSLLDITDSLWRVYLDPACWFNRTIKQIAEVIYTRCYLRQSPDTEVSSTTKATEKDASYLRDVHEVYGKEPSTLAPGAIFDATSFVTHGRPTKTRFRIYVHCQVDTAIDVLREVVKLQARTKAIQYTKIASSREIGTRPDGIVIYVDGDEAVATQIANELSGAVAGTLETGTPALTCEVQPGIGISWNPQSVLKTEMHSFGTFQAGILAEALYDMVASSTTRSPGLLCASIARMYRRYGIALEKLYTPPRSREAPPLKSSEPDHDVQRAIADLSLSRPDTQTPTQPTRLRRKPSSKMLPVGAPRVSPNAGRPLPTPHGRTSARPTDPPHDANKPDKHG